MKSIEDFLHEEDTDMSVAMSAMVNGKYCFVIQPPKRWGKTPNGRDILFFGGVGGKLEAGESLVAALHREAAEEICCQIEIVADKQTDNLPLVSRQQIVYCQTKATPSTPLPLCIFQNRRSEPGRKSKTNVFIYQTRIADAKNMKPADNPAIILLPPQTLLKMENGMDLAKAVRQEAEIISQIELPPNAVLMPTPTPLALIKLYQTQENCAKSE